MGVIRGGVVSEGASRLLSCIRETVLISAFTDGGGASGTYQMADSVPAKAFILYSRCVVNAAASGDTTAVLTIGDGSDVDRYNTGTPSVFTTGDKDMGVPSGTKYHTTAVNPTLTVTGGSDFGLVATTGSVMVEIWFFEAA